jgi:(1->4)-alpha-D-glucan 1-alpha-D-glucosylmutase
MTPGGPPLEHADVVDAVRDVSSRLRVYRTYRRHDEPPSEADSDRIAAAVEAARHDLDGGANPAIDPVSAVLHGPLPDGSAAWDAVAHWQQLTAPVVAKGVEDSALYAPGTLLVSADVGSDPDRPATTPEEMHSFLARRRESWPATMNALSTHDSKRGHDVRCRLAVLSEMAKDWEAVVAELDAGRDGDPDAVDRRYAYETIVGAWPAGGADEDFARRVREHLVKAAREAKRCTSWLWPEAKYEQALEEFADSVLGDATARDIVAGVVGTIDRAAITNSLASVVLRAAAPGAPDVYQGDDLRQLVLVDPDNRRRPDLDRHRDALSSLPAAATPELAGLLPDWSDGRIKQAVLRASLHARRANPQLFDEGDYLPLDVHGSEQAHLFAFARRLHDHAAVCVVPRLPYTLAGADAFAVGGVWRDTAIELGELTGLPLVDVLTGRGLEPDGRQVAADLLDVLPVALLVTAG